MAKSATLAELEDLHKTIARSLKTRLEQDLDDNIPTDAATLGVAVKFLKDNAITADPADADDLSDLRNKLKEAAEARKKKLGSVVALADADLEQQYKEA